MTTIEIDRLNREFGVDKQLRFESGPGDLAVAKINNSHATAMVALQGAHVMTYQPHGQEPVLWLSGHAKFAPGKSIRGGVPICWPWFGPHASEPAFPGHGFARTVMWEVLSAQVTGEGATRLVFRLSATSKNPQQWPYASDVTLTVTIGARLELDLATVNSGSQALVLGDALHTYFTVGDVRKMVIHGLEGCPYIDKVDASKRKIQTGGVTIGAEVDRIYLDSARDCVIEDQVLRRRIRIAKRNSRSTIVWNPWIDKAAKMGDFGPDGYLGMVCVESANADADVVSLAPGGEHHLQVVYSVESMSGKA
jgi:glucose-6-phosphate 1-epimerase